MARLAPVLHVGDLPLAELCAARLDGQLVAVDGAFCPVDTGISPVERAAAASRDWSSRLIAEQLSAAWIWGALLDPPARHQLCASSAERARSPGAPQAREVVIDQDEIARLGGARVTTPLRTVADIARFSQAFGETEAGIIRRLMLLDGVTLDDCRSALDRRRNLPGKTLAWARIRAAAGGNAGLA
jgi:hypothetical protein